MRPFDFAQGAEPVDEERRVPAPRGTAYTIRFVSDINIPATKQGRRARLSARPIEAVD